MRRGKGATAKPPEKTNKNAITKINIKGEKTMANIISGKEVSLKVKGEVREKALELKAKGIEIGLAVIIVGDNPASRGR